MIDKGYIKLFRKFFLEHEFWLEDRTYSKAEAWIDLIYCARWGKEPKQMIDKRGSYVLEFGDIYISYRYLGKRWSWSKNKVDSVLAHLAKRKSITYKKRDSHRTIINITNLRTYIEWENGKKDSERTVKGQGKDSEGTKKKTEKERKEKIYSSFFDEFWNLYPRKNGIRPAKKKTKERFFKVVKEDELPTIVLAVKNYAVCEKVSNGYIKDPLGFVSDEFWKDHIEPETRGTKKIEWNNAKSGEAIF